MEKHQLPLWEENHAANGEFSPFLEFYLIDRATPGGIVIILPGGGYEMRADHEGAPVAKKFNALGFHAAVLHYRIAPRRYPDPQLDALRAIQLVRLIGSKANINANKVAILGFSAGGHLAGCAGTLFDDIEVVANDDGDKMSAKPDAMLLCYPVISSGQYGNQYSFNKLIGENENPELRKYLSLETKINNSTPPTFLWHTAEDETVPVQNSLLFAESMREHGRIVELHVFPEGRHGIGLAENFSAHIWPELAAEFLKRLDF